MNFSILCSILVAFAPEISESLLTIAPFAAIRQKWHITQNISEYPGPALTNFTGLVGVLLGMIFEIFVWRSLKGCCYGNQLNMGDVRKRRIERPLLQFSVQIWQLALKRTILPRFAHHLTTIFIHHVGVSKRIGRS